MTITTSAPHPYPEEKYKRDCRINDCMPSFIQTTSPDGASQWNILHACTDKH